MTNFSIILLRIVPSVQCLLLREINLTLELFLSLHTKNTPSTALQNSSEGISWADLLRRFCRSSWGSLVVHHLIWQFHHYGWYVNDICSLQVGSVTAVHSSTSSKFQSQFVQGNICNFFGITGHTGKYNFILYRPHLSSPLYQHLFILK